MAETIVVTPEGLKKLQDELEYLKTVKRKDNVEAIRVALSFGDLSENSEYDEAKTEQGKTESRIIELEEMLKHVKVISDHDIKTDIVNVGNTVLVIEHNLDVIKVADHIIDLGPEGGNGGGTIVAQGTPEEVCKCEKSYTGQFLKKILDR